jgi:uncharacterized membrane protein
MAIFKLIHLLAALVWLGGMFFAYVVLRPAAVAALPPPERLQLWDQVFQRFFNWVWGALGLLLITGFYLIYLRGGIAQMPGYVLLMLVLGLVMMVIYGYVFFACYVPFNLHVSKQRWLEAGEQLGKIRSLVAVNLLLGGLIVAVVVLGATGI